MLKNLRFPLIYVLELILWLPLLASFFIAMAFVEAEPVSALDLHGKSLPSDWEAAVSNHRTFFEWLLINNHLPAFSASLLVFLATAIALYPVMKAQLWQSQQAAPADGFKHKAAQLFVGGAIVAVGYYIITQVMVGVAPA